MNENQLQALVDIAREQSGSSISPGLVSGGITAGASLLTGLMKMQAEKDAQKRKLEEDTLSLTAQGQQELEAQKLKGQTMPLKELMASYKAGLGG